MPDNLLTRKLGPLPTWGWMGIGTVGFGVFYLYEAHKNAAAGTVATATTAASNVPDYVFQNYNEIPTAAAAPTAAAGSVPTTPTPSPGPGPVIPTPPILTPPQHIGAGNAPANPGTHIYTSNGKMTLAQVAKQHHTTPQAIIAATHKNKNNIGKSLAAYFKRGNFNEPIPKGTTIVYKNG